MPRNLTMRTQLMLAAAGLVVGAVVIVTVVVTGIMARASGAEAEARGRALLGEYAATISQELGSVATMVTSGVAAVEGALDAGGADRDMLGRMVRQMLATRPDLVGMTLAFDVDALDGRDAAHVGHPYSDETGRFVPYFYHDARGAIVVEQLDMSPEAGTEEWYDRPMRENRALLTPPYTYEVEGARVLMTTISGVVRRDGRPIGILTGDIALDRVSARIAALRPFGDGRVYLVSADNAWVAHPDASRLGAAVPAGDPRLAGSAGAVRHAALDGVETMLLSERVRFPGLSESWLLVMAVPRATVYAGVTQTRTLAMTVGLGLLAVTLVLAWLGARMVSTPIGRMTGVMDRLARGDLATDIPYGARGDEIGAMARAVTVFRDNAHATRRLEAEAETARAERAAAAAAEAARQTRVVTEIGEGLARLAAGDLTRPIASPAHDPFPADYDALRQSFNEVLDNLARTMGQIAAVAGSVRAGAEEISAAAADLSRRTEGQAATLEQSAAALNELTESVRSTAQRSAAAVATSRAARTQAETGVGVVGEAVAAMRRIEASSDQITRIIGVIDDIAFQTNLLALNAGVEAARAGNSGRGFAVVASEVRGLAQRASDSAREIKTLIQDSGAQVTAGSELVRRTGSSLEEILRRVSEVSELMAGIAVAAAEQASGLDEINTGVNQLDQATQQNAAVAEETTAATTSLQHKSEELTDTLADFRLPATAVAAAARQRTARRA